MHVFIGLGRDCTQRITVLISIVALLSLSPIVHSQETDPQAIEKQITEYTRKINTGTDRAGSYLGRGNAYFQLHHFEMAIDDFSAALAIDDTLDEAYFGRGLALGRDGRIEAGIADLDIYIERNPKNSRAYTKRGVRYLWLDDEKLAQRDLLKAIALDDSNAEAHDDLGVIYSRNHQYSEAANHFLMAIEYDPTYQKAFHNMAMICYLTNKDEWGLGFVNSALRLSPDSRDSLMLKSRILASMGDLEAARELKEEAEFLPDGNWSERIPVQ